MKAAVQSQYGGPEVLEMAEVEKPRVGRRDVLIEVHASPVTQGDRRLRSADFPGATAVIGRLMFGVLSPRNPTPGTMFAGRVIAVGEGVTRFQVGDRLFGSCDHSAQAEYLVVSETAAMARIPANVSYAEAAATPYGAVTALAFLRDVAKLQPGEKLLVVGASGGVGRFAVQIGRHLGAHVTGVCSGRHARMVRDLGAHATIDHRESDYTEAGEQYDVIFDTHSGDGFQAAKAALTGQGRYVTLYASLRVLWQSLTTAVFGGKRAAASVVLGNAMLSKDVAELLADGAIKPTLGGQYALSEVAKAHEELEHGRLAATTIVVPQATAA